MTANGMYRVLGLSGYEVGESFEEGGVLYVPVSVPRASCRCRRCGCKRVHRDGYRERMWQASPLGLKRVFVVMRAPRVKCLSCGSKTWHQPTFAEGQRQITKDLEETIEFWLSRLTIQDVVETFGISWNTVCEIDTRRLKKLVQPGLKKLKRLAIDENYLGKRHKYITVVLDLDTRAIVSVTQGRGQAALKGFFSRLKQAGAKIKAVATDMAGGYIAAVLKYLPKAKLVFDHFHVIKLMNEKLTKLRRDLYRELTEGLGRKVLKGIRWLLLKNRSNLSQTDKRDEKAELDEALKLNRPLAIAYYLKEDLRRFWKQKSKQAARQFLDDWCRRAAATGTAVLQTMSKTLQAKSFGLLNWYNQPLSTGPLEGINNKIGALQRRAYGYRNYEHLKLKLLTLHHTKYTLVG